MTAKYYRGEHDQSGKRNKLHDVKNFVLRINCQAKTESQILTVYNAEKRKKILKYPVFFPATDQNWPAISFSPPSLNDIATGQRI